MSFSRGLDLGPVGGLGDGGIDDIPQQGEIGGHGGVVLIVHLGRQVLDGAALAAEHVQHVGDRDRRGVEVEDAAGRSRAELGRGKSLPGGGEAAVELGEEDPIARLQVFLALAQTGQGRLQVVILGHGFLDHRVQLGRLEQMPPIGGDFGALLEALGLAVGRHRCGRAPAPG